MSNVISFDKHWLQLYSPIRDFILERLEITDLITRWSNTGMEPSFDLDSDKFEKRINSPQMDDGELVAWLTGLAIKNGYRRPSSVGERAHIVRNALYPLKYHFENPCGSVETATVGVKIPADVMDTITSTIRNRYPSATDAQLAAILDSVIFPM